MTEPRAPRRRMAASLLPLLALAGCDTAPRSIRYGQDECAACSMILVDPHYGAEFITRRGKVYTFDDLNCLTTHERRLAAGSDARTKSVVVDFNRPNHFIAVEQAWFLQHPALRTPMDSRLAAFTSEVELEAVRRQLDGGGRVLRWAGVKEIPP